MKSSSSRFFLISLPPSIIIPRSKGCVPYDSERDFERNTAGTTTTTSRVFFPKSAGIKFRGINACTKRGRDDRFKRALRERIKPVVHGHRLARPTCEVCGVAPSEDTHHADPEFNVIQVTAMAMLSENDKDKLIKAYDWTIDDEFQLPDFCPAVQCILKEHETAKLLAVCKACHARLSCEYPY
jgi:hypothetical protein